MIIVRVLPHATEAGPHDVLRTAPDRPGNGARQVSYGTVLIQGGVAGARGVATSPRSGPRAPSAHEAGAPFKGLSLGIDLQTSPRPLHHAKLKLRGLGHPAGVPGRLHYHFDLDVLDARHA